MDYKPQPPMQDAPAQPRHHEHSTKMKPRIIIHGGAGNIPATMAPEKYQAYKTALITIIAKTESYMTTPLPSSHKLPNALETATFAMVQLENNPLFNSGHGAVFTRDGINELEASLMITRGYAKRGVGVTGLQKVKNPILLAKEMLVRGEDDLWGKTDLGWAAVDGSTEEEEEKEEEEEMNIPGAQGHTLLHGKTAEVLAKRYGLELVGPDYFFTQNRWDEHIRALEREKEQREAKSRSGQQAPISATWSADEYLPQGTCGAVAMDEDGTICVATSTGGMTNKLTGRIGDTPSVGAGFWAEEWEEEVEEHKAVPSAWASVDGMREYFLSSGRTAPIVELSSTLRGFLADCLPAPVSLASYHALPQSARRKLKTTRSTAISGTGNGDSFLRIAAVRTVAAIARYSGVSTREALTRVTGPGGELQKSAQDRWGKTGEGEGGMIGIESAVTVEEVGGRVVACKSEIVQDHNSMGMFRAWIDDDGKGKFQIWHDQGPEVVDDLRRYWDSEKGTATKYQ